MKDLRLCGHHLPNWWVIHLKNDYTGDWMLNRQMRIPHRGWGIVQQHSAQNTNRGIINMLYCWWSFCLFLSIRHMLEPLFTGKFDWGTISIWLINRPICGACSQLMIDMEGPVQSKRHHPWQMVLRSIRKVEDSSMRSKPERFVLLWPLIQMLSQGSCLRILLYITTMIIYDLGRVTEINLFFSKLILDEVFFTTIKTQLN